jgi:hypothetical protein
VESVFFFKHHNLTNYTRQFKLTPSPATEISMSAYAISHGTLDVLAAASRLETIDPQLIAQFDFKDYLLAAHNTVCETSPFGDPNGSDMVYASVIATVADELVGFQLALERAQALAAYIPSVNRTAQRYTHVYAEEHGAHRNEQVGHAAEGAAVAPSQRKPRLRTFREVRKLR